MSPRGRKPRNCCCPYRGNADEIYKPSGTPLRELDQIILRHDEMEAMFLCDSENLTQVEAGSRMGISRGTVQRMLAQARKKVIEAIVQGKALVIMNGHECR
jgi:predicted DNA-binding protein (UPF0251 family)